MEYNYAELHSMPFISAGSDIPLDLLHLSHSFGYNSRHRANLKLLDDATLLYIAGNLLVLLDVHTKKQKYLRSCSGEGIGAITTALNLLYVSLDVCMKTHPNKDYFVVAEKGKQPIIVIYQYPSLRPYRILRGGTEQVYTSVDFNQDGSFLASVGGAPDYMLTVWDWRQEEVMLSCKAFSQDVYRVSFSPHSPELITSSGAGHIKFWTMSTTFTGLKLQGVIGHFGEALATDIEGFVELPDKKVVTGTEWGNLLLWDGQTIKMEISRKEGQSCHVGMVQPFCLEDGQLMTFGADGMIRGWDFEKINMADSHTHSRMLEMEPINELVVGHNVCLTSVVRSFLPNAFIWFAQDSNGAIWKLDLSFTNTTPDPECLFSFHAGPIRGLDVCKTSHLMATTALDRSVKVFDFLANKELTTTSFNQGGTTISWAPSLVEDRMGLLATGFEDGVVRLLELYNPQRMHGLTKGSCEEGGKLHLKQAFKPHSESVTALAYERNGAILATGSTDGTVFFFSVGEKYKPIGFISVPGPVQALEWSPPLHSQNSLLILCLSGHVVEVNCPNPKNQEPTNTFQLPELCRRSFRFQSIKSRIKREEEFLRLQTSKGKIKKVSEENSNQLEADEEDEKEEVLPPIYIPDPPSPLYCGFYSQPGQFWLSMGGFDSGYLYHCKFSENQDKELNMEHDEPFHFLPIHNADYDPICSITFSSNRQLLFCGMHSGSIRVYPLQPGDINLTSMQPYWVLSMHDNQNGHLHHIHCSYDDLFVLTAGDDGNIFSFTMLPPEELESFMQSKADKITLLRVELENQALVLDIEDPAAYSIEAAKKRQEKDNLRQEAEQMMSEAKNKMAELRKKFKQVLDDNQHITFPKHICLTPEELQLNQHFDQQAENLKAQVVTEVKRELAWEQERCCIELEKRQHWDPPEINIVTIVAIHSNHRVSTYPVPSVAKPPLEAINDRSSTPSDETRDGAPARDKYSTHKLKNSNNQEALETDVVYEVVVQKSKIKLSNQQEERLRRIAEKAQRVRAKIEKRKQEWAQIYAEKPKEDHEDLEDVQALLVAREKIWDIRGRNHNQSIERKKEELMALESHVFEQQATMNKSLVSLQHSQVCLISSLQAQNVHLQNIQDLLAPHLHQPVPNLPKLLPNETLANKLQHNKAFIEQYEGSDSVEQKKQDNQERTASFVKQLEKVEKEKTQQEYNSTSSVELLIASKDMENAEYKVEELNKVKDELQKEEEIRLLYKQNLVLKQMQSSASQFDAELMFLRSQKLHLDDHLKRTELCQLMLFQEMLLLKHFESRKVSLHNNEWIKEENILKAKLEECKAHFEEKMRDVAKVQEREKALTAAFKASVGENHEFENFLTKIFKKKVKRTKTDETTGGDVEEEDSDEEVDWNEVHYSDTEEDDTHLNDTVCPSGCDLELFEHTLQMRERRLVLEDLLIQEKEAADILRKECETLVKKEKMVRSKRQAVDNDLEVMNREIQEKMNELDMLLPLKLHQIEFARDGVMPTDLSQALVLNKCELTRLQEGIQQLQAEALHEKDLQQQTHQQHAKLISECRDMTSKIKMLEKKCDEQMMSNFGRLVDLEDLQTLPENRRQEELRHEKFLKEAAHDKELKQWDRKLEEAHQALMEVIQSNTGHLRSMLNAVEEKRELENIHRHRQRETGRQQFQDYSRCVDKDEICWLQQVIQMQSEQIKAIRMEICLLSCKGGHVLPSDITLLYPQVPALPLMRGPNRLSTSQ